MQQFSDNPPKKPPETVSIDDRAYLKAHVNNLLREAHELDRRRETLHDRIREFSRILRQKNGNSVWAPIACAVTMCVVFVVVLDATSHRVHILSQPEALIRVLHQYDDYSFQLQVVLRGVPQPPSVWHFCSDFRPLIQIGFTLTQLQWIDKDGCSEISPKFIHHAYIIQRDSRGWPTVPKNCVNLFDRPSFCNGDPQFD